MKKCFTVYFDTNFFVWLRKADETLALDVIDDLNSLDVRHVLSDVLARELLANGKNPDFDEILVDRVERFKLTPFCTNPDLTWQGLRFAPQRPATADLFKILDGMLVEAKSQALMAGRSADGRLSPEQIATLRKVNEPFLKQLGISLDPENKVEDLESIQAFAEGMLGILRDVIPEGLISGEIQWSGDPREDSSMLLGLLQANDIEAAKESNFLNESITASEDRPYQVAAGVAGKSTKQNLANSLRDSEHMHTFILHKNEIDALQIDRAQMNILKRPNPEHRLVQLGLSDRCFTVGSLQEIVETIRKMKQ